MVAIRQIQRRLSELKMSKETLARRSDVSVSTLRRIFADPDRVSLGQLRALAHAVGLQVNEDALLEGPSAHEYKRRVADQKARRLAEKLQGTSALEAQGLTREQLDEIREQNFFELMSGSPRRVWGDE